MAFQCRMRPRERFWRYLECDFSAGTDCEAAMMPWTFGAVVFGTHAFYRRHCMFDVRDVC
jgi:hypothetical protein